MATANLTAQRLRELLSYCPDTGLFHWLCPAGVPAGCDNGQGYLRIGVDGRVYFAQRLAWLYVTGEWPNSDVDHINGQTLDNRFCNLRPASRSQNNINSKLHKDNTSGHRGVIFNRGRWMARIGVNRKKVFLGRFDTPEEAAEAYRAAAMNIYGEFLRTDPVPPKSRQTAMPHRGERFFRQEKPGVLSLWFDSDDSARLGH